MTTRVFNFHDEKSSKFWEISQSGEVVTVRYGKSDTTGQSQIKSFADVASANKHAQRLIIEKLAKGYVEHGAAAVTSTSLPLASVSAPAKQFKKSKVSRPVVTKPINPARDLDASPESLSAWFGKDDTTNRLLAKHPKASADLLEKLSHSSDKATRQAVTANPNTPPETYVRLGQQFPKEFLANPALDLLLFMNPALMDEVPEALLVRLLKQDDCPTSMLTWAAAHRREKVQLAVAMNAAVPEQALQRLRESSYPAVRQAVEVKPSTTSEQDPEREFEQAVRDRLGSLKPRELLEAWSSGDIGLAQWSALPLTFRLAKAASDGFTPQGVVRGLRHESEIHEIFREICFNYLEDPVIRGVAGSPDTPTPILEELSNPYIFMLGDWSWTRRVVAENPSTPLTILEQFANYDSPSLYQERAAVAENPATPEILINSLSKDSNYHVRGVVAAKPSAPAYLLESLFKDPDAWVRSKLAQNTSTAAPTLAALSKDADRDVRFRVAGNPFTPAEVLMLLAEDSDNSVQIAVAENSATTELIREQLLDRLSIHSNERFRSEVAKNQKATPHLLEALSSDPHQWVRRAVAANQSTPLHVLTALSRDSESSVREKVAKNPSTPSSMLEKLGTDSNGDVKIAVVGNQNTPNSVLIKLLSSKTVSVRQSVASQAHRSPEILNALWNDANDAVRRAVANCAGLDQEVLDKLVHDSDLESDLVTLFGHPNLSAKSIQYIAERLLNTPATSSAWYQRELAKAKVDVSAAVQANDVLSYPGKDPNKAVLSARAIAPVMALCSGPFIEPARLVKVVGSTDWLARAAVARNPGTPPNLIKKLSADAHPLVSALAKRAQAVTEEPPIKSSGEQVKELDYERALNEVLDRIRKATTKETREGMRLLFNTVTSTAWGDRTSVGEILTSMRHWYEIDNLFLLVRSELENTLIPLLWEMGSKALHPGARKLIANHPECPLDVLRTLAKDDNLDVMVTALKNSAFPEEEKNKGIKSLRSLLKLRILRQADPLTKGFLSLALNNLNKVKANHSEKQGDHEVLANANSPANSQFALEEVSDPVKSLAELHAMTNDSARDVRCDVAKNIFSPASLLEVLSEDADIYVRCAVAKNKNAPIYLLERLANDPDLRVKDCVAKNVSTTGHTLETLSKVFSPPIIETTEYGTPILSWGYIVRQSVAANPSTPAHVLLTLALDEELEVRRKVFSNTVASTETRNQVLDLWVIPLRRALLREASIREGKAAAPQVPIATSDLVQALTWLEYIPGWPDNKALTKASRSRDWLTRLGSALHPSASEGILKLLQQDSDPDVASAALTNMATNQLISS